jgi:hypothetical protein
VEGDVTHKRTKLLPEVEVVVVVVVDFIVDD